MRRKNEIMAKLDTKNKTHAVDTIEESMIDVLSKDNVRGVALFFTVRADDGTEKPGSIIHEFLDSEETRKEIWGIIKEKYDKQLKQN